MDSDKLIQIVQSLGPWKPFLTALATILASIIRLFIQKQKGYLKSSKKQKYVNLINQLQYNDETGKNNLRNSFIFEDFTKKTAPIHVINLIMNCYDPGECIYIYSNASGFINFKNDKLSEPNKLEFSKKLLYLTLLLMIISLVLILFIIYSLFHLASLEAFKELLKDPKSLNIIIFVIFLFIFCFCILMINLFFLFISFKDLELIRRVKLFYKNS